MGISDLFKSFKRGHTYYYQEINKEIGYPPETGLQKAILTIPIPERHSIMLRVKEDVDYYDDDFTPESDVLYYIGQGRPEQGPQSPTRGNKRIIDNEDSDFYLFVQPKGESGYWTYRGKWGLVDIDPSYESDQIVEGWKRQRVFRFKFVRKGSGAEEAFTKRSLGNVTPTRYDSITSRIDRDSALSHSLKDAYNHRCQICCKTIETPDSGRYCEVHHIKPLGTPHNGPDIKANLIVLCPNHHVEMDRGAFYISYPDMKVHHFNPSNPYHGRIIRRHKDHKIGKEFLEYHRENICLDWAN